MSIIDRVRIKYLETRGKAGALFRNRRLKRTQAFKTNLSGWDKLFETRVDSNISLENVERIRKAYRSAISEKFNRDLYYVSNEWVPVYKKNMSVLIKAIEESSTAELRGLFDNFFREKFSNGLVGLPINMQKIFKHASTINKNWYLIDALYRYELLKKKVPNLDLRELSVGNYGNPFGVFIDEVFLRVNADYQFYFAKRIKEMLGGASYPVVLEIGGGFGGTALFLKRQIANAGMYINLDLPETLMLSSYYLMSNFPTARFNLYGEEYDSDADFTLYPAFTIEDFPKITPQLALNSYSFGEMSSLAAQNYINRIAEMRVGLFYHINHTTNSKTGAENLKFPGYELIRKERSLWNLGRSSTADEYEYLYRINVKS